MTQTTHGTIREAIQAALDVTSDIKDATLRSVAYQVVLGHLLQTGLTSDLEEVARRGVSGHKKGDRAPTSAAPVPRDGPSKWVMSLVDEGYFREPRQIGDVVRRLAEVGHTVLSKDVSYPLARFCELRILRRVKSGKDESGKKSWVYSPY